MQLGDLKIILTPSTERIAALPQHVAAFCRLMVAEQRPLLHATLESGSSTEEQERSYEMVSAMGFALAAGHRSEKAQKAFLADTERLSGRKFFSHTARFEQDGYGLLGVSLGLVAMGVDASSTKWLHDLLEKSLQAVSGDAWQSALVRCAQRALSAQDFASVGSDILSVGFGFAIGQDISADQRQRAWTQTLGFSGADEVPVLCAKRAVFDSAANALASMSLDSATIEGLIRILEGISRSMARWTFEESSRTRSGEAQKWHIDNEYHVQNLLWAILAPIFADLVDEQYLPATGHRQSRYDLGIPSLRTIIEVKYLRGRGQAAFSALTEEIAADVALYLKPGSGYDRIIPFIWDENTQTEEHAKLIAGLETLKGVVKAIVLPRPARMRRGVANSGCR